MVAAGIERDITPQKRQAWAHGTPADWANEAHAIARDQIYPPLRGARICACRAIMPGAKRRWRGYKLAKAGVRLAWLLNTDLK